MGGSREKAGPGGPAGGAPAEARRAIAAAREACGGCPYFAVCPLAPLFLQAEAPPGGRKAHPHGRSLELYLERLRRVSDNHERDLLAAMNGEDEGLGLVAGCLLATEHWGETKRLRRLLEAMNAKFPPGRRGGEGRLLTQLEEQLQRAAAISQDPAVPPLLRGSFRLRRPDREVTAYEAVRLVARLLAGETAARWWMEAVHEEDRAAFEASFALRDKAAGDESHSGGGGLDLFFSARSGPRSLVFYYRRDGATGKQALVPVEGVRADSLLKRMFKVFDTDRKKTHRLFAKMCRGLNNGYKQLDKKLLWEGLKRLDREHLVVLALYAPRLAKFVEKRAEFPGLYRLVKFLHVNVADDENGIPAHVKVFERRAQVGTILEMYGKESFMNLCRTLFRIAEAYRPGPASADLIYKIGEVAYLLTAVEGFNPRGLEFSLAGRNPLAFIGYGLQPAAQKEGGLAHRYRRLFAARARIEAEALAPPDGNGTAVRVASGVEASHPDARELLTAIDQGFAYMAVIHGHADVAAMARAVQNAPASQSQSGIIRPGAGSRP